MPQVFEQSLFLFKKGQGGLPNPFSSPLYFGRVKVFSPCATKAVVPLSYFFPPPP